MTDPAAVARAGKRLQGENEGKGTLNPIPGLRKVPLLTLEKTLDRAAGGDEEFEAAMPELAIHLRSANIFAENFFKNPPPGAPPGGELDREEVLAIWMYTSDSPLFPILNTRLRTENRTVLKPFLPLLKLILTGLYKLPLQAALVYRGVRGDFSADFRIAEVKIWWGFSSTTSDLARINDTVFFGYDGHRTYFVIDVCGAFDVRRYSAFPHERELLLAPGTTLRVDKISFSPPDVHNIMLTQEPFVPLPDDEPAGELRARLTAAETKIEALLAENSQLKQANAALQAENEKLKLSSAEKEKLLQAEIARLSLSSPTNAPAPAAPAAASPVASSPSPTVKPPNLAALPLPRPILAPTFRSPVGLSIARDGSILVADSVRGVVAARMWLDGSRPAQLLPPVTNFSNHVLPLSAEADDADALLVVSYGESRVERSGRHTWRRMDLVKPWAAVVDGTTVLVTEYGAGRVARLDLRTGETTGTFGEGKLKNPHGIALAPSGEIVVADYMTALVSVFNKQGTLLRAFGKGFLQNPQGVCVDVLGRIYVADSGFDARVIVVLDGVSGSVLASIKTECSPFGVLVTPSGEIVASVYDSDETKRRLLVVG